MKWQEPPGGSKGRSQILLTEAAELRANPKRWALIITRPTDKSASQFAFRIRNGLNAAWRPAGTFEAVSRGCDVYARYVGDPDE